MTARLKEIAFDRRHPAALARFWAALVGGYAIRPTTARKSPASPMRDS